jgi:hypothetical protein
MFFNKQRANILLNIGVIKVNRFKLLIILLTWRYGFISPECLYFYSRHLESVGILQISTTISMFSSLEKSAQHLVEKNVYLRCTLSYHSEHNIVQQYHSLTSKNVSNLFRLENLCPGK